MKDYYQILGVQPNASRDEIKKAYHRSALKLHPDKNLNTSRSNKDFQNLDEAYKVLSDPKKRSSYDDSMGYNNKAPKDSMASENIDLETAFSRRQARGFKLFEKTWISELYEDLNNSKIHKKYWFSGEQEPIVRGDVNGKTDFDIYYNKDNFTLDEEGNCIKLPVEELVKSEKTPKDIKDALRGVNKMDAYILNSTTPINTTPLLVFQSKDLESIVKLTKAKNVQFEINDVEGSLLLKEKLASQRPMR